MVEEKLKFNEDGRYSRGLMLPRCCHLTRVSRDVGRKTAHVVGSKLSDRAA